MGQAHVRCQTRQFLRLTHTRRDADVARMRPTAPVRAALRGLDRFAWIVDSSERAQTTGARRIRRSFALAIKAAESKKKPQVIIARHNTNEIPPYYPPRK